MGALSSCAGYILLSQLSGLWQYYIGYALIGAAVAPIFSGYLFDTTGTYDTAFLITAIAIALGIPVIIAIRRPKTYSTPNDR